MPNTALDPAPTAMSPDEPLDDLIALVAARGRSEKLARLLGDGDLEVKSFDDGHAVLELSSELRPALIVLWVENTLSGLVEDVEPLAHAFAQTPIIVTCLSIERWGVRSALAAGAAGVVLAGDFDSALRPCADAVRAGLTCVPRGHWRQIEPPALSSREKQILGLVVMGYTNGQIARQLFLAESTVKSHLSSAFGKLGVRSRNEAVNLILDPERGLGMGILALGGEPLTSTPTS
jgi:DNA-binding NarL/FixJ family response regulator